MSEHDEVMAMLRRIEAAVDNLANRKEVAPVPLLDDGRMAYRINEACATLGISRPKLYLEIKEGRLKMTKAGGMSFIRKADLEKWLYRPPTKAEAKDYIEFSDPKELRKALRSRKV